MGETIRIEDTRTLAKAICEKKIHTPVSLERIGTSTVAIQFLNAQDPMVVHSSHQI